jgi:RNA polymerase sigma-70 factor (ECF subfamily)
MTASHRDIEAEIPRLRRYARALVRDVGAADDLVQDCLARALSRLHLWQEGTNLRAWLFTILHNQHVNRIRESIRAGTPVELSEAGSLLSQPANQDGCLELRDLERALARLPEEQRAVILLVGLEGMRYEHAGAVLGIPTGTVRSRLSRGRRLAPPDGWRPLRRPRPTRGPSQKRAPAIPLGQRGPTVGAAERIVGQTQTAVGSVMILVGATP